MQLTGDMDWDEPKTDGTGRFDLREELATFGSLPSRATHDRRSADRDMYFDMDVALPFHWESMTGKGHKLSKSTDSQEFEFSMGADSAEPVEKEISPADDLFYKGQLLPLHLPKRLQMVQKLSSPKHSDKGNSSVTVSCFFQPSSLKYTALGMDESYLGSALVNSRSSSFRSQESNNFWESDSPGDVDSGDSSSSRDSSGSSQDACVPEKQNHTSFKEHITFNSHCSSKDRGYFQERDFFSNHGLRSEKSLFSSWLRTPFKWKVFFGLKRASKSKVDGKAEDPRRMNKLPNACGEDPYSSTNFRPSRPRSFSADQKKLSNRKESNSELPHSGLLSGSTLEAKERPDHERSISASKARESLNKYLNILKPLNVKGLQKSDPVDVNVRMVDISATTFSGNLSASPKHSSFSAGLPSPKAAFAKSMSSPKPSFAEKRPPVIGSLSGNLRVPSFSRGSKASISAGNAVARASSPNHSGVLPSSSPSAMAELHSAIQGAIAHCKQSQVKSDI